MTPQRRLTNTQLATVAGVHRNTICKYRHKYGIQARFANIVDEELIELIKQFKVERPESGLRYLMGFLQAKGITIQRERVRLALSRVDGVGQALRRHLQIDRRPYSVSHPNKLWHLDGHHKLITWGIVVHGIVDGYCRTVRRIPILSVIRFRCTHKSSQVVGLRAASNNTADTVLNLFLEAVDGFGLPSRVRGDRGGENKKVAVYMVMRCGPGRGSFLWGRYVCVFQMPTPGSPLIYFCEYIKFDAKHAYRTDVAGSRLSVCTPLESIFHTPGEMPWSEQG